MNFKGWPRPQPSRSTGRNGPVAGRGARGRGVGTPVASYHVGAARCLPCQTPASPSSRSARKSRQAAAPALPRAGIASCRWVSVAPRCLPHGAEDETQACGERPAHAHRRCLVSAIVVTLPSPPEEGRLCLVTARATRRASPQGPRAGDELARLLTAEATKACVPTRPLEPSKARAVCLRTLFAAIRAPQLGGSSHGCSVTAGSSRNCQSRAQNNDFQTERSQPGDTTPMCPAAHVVCHTQRVI